jgi:hypothetical protein
MTKCTCQRCSHEWYPRIDPDTIKCCPSCKSRAWRTPRPEKVETLEERNKREVEEKLNHSCGEADCLPCAIRSISGEKEEV